MEGTPYRLHATSERLWQSAIERFVAALSVAESETRKRLKAAVDPGVALILEEHQDWQML